MSRTLSKVLRSLTVPFVGRGRSPRRLKALRWSGSELLEQRQLLTAATAAADTELQVYHSTGVNSVSIALPPDAVSFQAITFSPLLGTVVLNSSGPLSVNYEYSSSGVDSFGISYLDAYGSTRTQNVNIIIVDDYTGTDLLDSPDPQGEQDFLGGLYNGFVNSSGTGGVPTGGSAYYGGNGAGSVLGSGSGGTGGAGGGTSPAPEIAVYGKNLLIVDGDSTPSATDDTDYGIVSFGQFVDHTFTVTNSGTANLSLQLHQLPAGWMITESLSLYLAPGASDSFTVRFAPTSSGQYSADIIIDNNDADENPYNFVIRGATNAPEIGVSGNGIVIVDGDSTPAIPDGTQFGWINAGQSVTRTFTVNNSGSAVLTLQTPQLPFGFSLTEPLASQLAPGVNDTFTVSFSPQGAGTYSGEISIGNNDSDENPYNFAIQGSVSAPEIGVSGGGVGIDDGDWTPSTADGTNFGMISSGQSVTRTFTVQNSGSATLTLQSPQLPAGFVLTESLATQLAPGTSDTFSVQFSPVNPGTYSGEISIGNNDSNENPYNFAITGTMGGPEINVLGNGYVIVDGDTVPSAVDGTYFGTVGPGQTVDHTFIVNNTGTALLSLSLRALPAGFLLMEPLTSVLAAGGTDSFTVRFAPDVVGQYGGEIIIDNNDADEAPYNFAVFGIRGTPEMDVRGNGVSIADGDHTPSAADDTYFGMTPPNIVASRTFTVRNDGTTTLYLGQVSLGPGSGFRIGSDTLLSQIGPGQSDTFSVELVSATPGTFVRTVTIYNSDSDECPYDFVIRGIVGVPEIDLTGKGVSIADGDTTPSTTDDTDFGSVLVSTATTTHTLTKTFTVRNTGSGTLYLGTPSVTGTGFWRGAKALRTWLEPGESDTFDVNFASTTTGTFTGEVILYNSDANEAPYRFSLISRSGNAPVNITLNPSTIPENVGNASPVYIGDLAATDPDLGDTLSISLNKSVADGAYFDMYFGKIFANRSFDFEDAHGPDYTIELVAKDSIGLTLTRLITISITNVNEAPTDISLSPASIPENYGTPSHIYVGDLTASDSDLADTHSFILDSTFADGADFSIASNALYAKRSFDFEDAHGPAYSIRVTAVDAAGLLVTKVLTVSVTGVNEAPRLSPNQDYTIDENTPAGVTVGQLQFSDPDAIDTHSFTIVSGNTGNAFAVSSTGLITVQSSAALNYEQTSKFTLQVRVVDSGTPSLSDSQSVIINIRNTQEAPRIKDLDTDTAAFDIPSVTIYLDAWVVPGADDRSLVTAMTATDEDLGDEPLLTWKLAGGNTDGLFAISGSGAEAKIIASAPLTSATKSVYLLYIEVYDSSGLADHGEVEVTLLTTTVGVMSDTQAVEGSTHDFISLTFFRFDIHNNYSAPLTVQIDHSIPASEPTPSGLAVSDFGGSVAGLSLLTTKQIIIPANQQSVTVTLKASSDGLAEGLESEDAAISIVGGPSYQVTQRKMLLPGEDYRELQGTADLQVLDHLSLFVNGTPTAPDSFAISYNDIKQGSIGDCFFLVAVAELAITHNSLIANAIQPIAGSPDAYLVSYYGEDGIQRSTTVIIDLDRGSNGVHLSGDYDATGVEVWTWVLERAYAQTHSGYAPIDGGYAHDAWKWLTGKEAAPTYTETMTNEQIFDLIESSFGTGHSRGVMVSSPPNGSLLGVGGNHGWAVLEVQRNALGLRQGIVFYNPWGNSVTVPVADLKLNIFRVTIGQY